MKTNNQKSFTLIEILIYIAVLVIIVLSVSAVLSWSMKSNTKAESLREVSDNAREALGIITYEIREARSIYYPTSASTQLSLETLHYLPEGETSSYIDFYLCGPTASTLCFKKETQEPFALTSDKVEVDNLEFFLIATTTPSVQISLGVNFKNPQNRPEYQASINVTSTVSLRSY